MDEATEYANGLSGKLADEQRQLIVDSGETELVKPSADDVKAWREAMKPVWAQFEGDIGADLIEAAAACNK
jgi:C4-dicarboxylate-binding protein DctP